MTFPNYPTPANWLEVLARYHAWAYTEGDEYAFTGSLASNTEGAWDAVTWSDARTKPEFSELYSMQQEAFNGMGVYLSAVNQMTDHATIAANSAAITSINSALSSHTHTASQVTDFTEAAQDAVGGALSADFVYNDGANTIGKRAPEFTNNASRSFVTTAAAANGFQLSSDREAVVAYDVTVSSAVQIGVATNVAGYVMLEIAATNSATAGDWQEVARVGTGQNIGLALALSSTQAVSGTLAARVPAGYYARLRTVNSNGTPTYTYLNGQEVLL